MQPAHLAITTIMGTEGEGGRGGSNGPRRETAKKEEERTRTKRFFCTEVHCTRRRRRASGPISPLFRAEPGPGLLCH